MSRPVRTTHGDYGYGKRTGCPCEPCREGVYRYSKQSRLDRERGVEKRVPIEDVRPYVMELIQGGATMGQIASSAGITLSMVKNIVRKAKFVLRPTALKLLALQLEDVLEENALHSPLGVIRRIQALHALGWRKEDVAEAMGVTVEHVQRLVAQDRPVLTATVRKVDKAYRQLAQSRGPSERLLFTAYRKDWPPPACWDDIDNPESEPVGRVCCISQCHRSVVRKTLCVSHLTELSKIGGNRDPEHFRLAVLRLSRKSTYNREGLTQQIRELRELGYTTPADVARRLGRSQHHIEKLWKDVA